MGYQIIIEIAFRSRLERVQSSATSYYRTNFYECFCSTLRPIPEETLVLSLRQINLSLAIVESNSHSD